MNSSLYAVIALHDDIVMMQVQSIIATRDLVISISTTCSLVIVFITVILLKVGRNFRFFLLINFLLIENCKV